MVSGPGVMAFENILEGHDEQAQSVWCKEKQKLTLKKWKGQKKKKKGNKRTQNVQFKNFVLFFQFKV